jgi:hypothetical protein
VRIWEITAGANAPRLYVELNGEYEGTWGENMIRAINAEPDDDLALFTSPGNYLEGPAKGALIASGKVSELARPYEPPT